MSSVHETAVIDRGAHVGAETRIWHFTHVVSGAWVGNRCSIGQNCYIAKVRIGHGCRIQNNVSVYEGVTLEDDVFLGPSCVFSNVKHPRAHVARTDAFERTLVCRGVTIGANATILSGITIGEYALIGAGAVVTHDVPAFALMLGTPARAVGWACRCGETLAHNLVCTRCGDVYIEEHGKLAVAIEGQESQLVTQRRD